MLKHYSVLVASVFLIFFYLSQGNCEKSRQPDSVSREVESFKFEKNCTGHANLWNCCAGIDRILHFTACISFTYIIENDFGVLDVNVTLNDAVIVEKKSEVRNLPDLCFDAPYRGNVAKICFRLRNLNEEENHLNGCVYLNARLDGIRLFKIPMGCFHVPLPSIEKHSIPLID